MASFALRTTAFLLSLNLLFFTLVTSQAQPSPQLNCPTDALKFGACASLLNDLVHGIVVGTPPTLPCCNILFGLVELEAATCLCRAIQANLLGVTLNASASLSLVFNNCGKEVPSGFVCA